MDDLFGNMFHQEIYWSSHFVQTHDLEYLQVPPNFLRPGPKGLLDKRFSNACILDRTIAEGLRALVMLQPITSCGKRWGIIFWDPNFVVPEPGYKNLYNL